MYINYVFENDNEVKEKIEKDVENHNSIKVVHKNIRSLRKNWDQLQQQIEAIKVKWDIIALTEINIKKEEVDSYNIKGYIKKALTRETTKRGGGAMVYIKENQLITECKEITLEELNGLEIKIESDNNKHIRILIIYREPDKNKKVFLSSLKKIINNDNEEWDNQLIMGDLNIDILNDSDSDNDKYDQNNIDKYENLLAKTGFEKLIDSPTREETVMKNGEYYMQRSCLDHAYIKTKKWKAKGATFTKKISDHYFTMCWTWEERRKFENTDDDQGSFIEYNHKNIIEELKEIKWEILDKIASPNKTYKVMNEHIEKIYQRNRIERNKINKNRKKLGRKEWITEAIIEQIESKNKLWKQIRTSKSVDQDLIARYKKEKNMIHKTINECKQNYYKLRLENLKKKNKSIWEVVNELTGREKPENIDNSIMKAFKGTKIATLANQFNDNFSGQVPKLKSEFEDEIKSFKGRKFYREEYIKNKSNNSIVNSNSMFIDYATEKEIIQIINELKNTNATGIDGIKTEHIKKSKENTAVGICKLIKKMIDEEVWPEMLKIQVLRPIFKKGSKIDKNNYRPISLLSIVDKIIEKFFANKIRNYLEKANALTNVQYGYKKNKGTTELLIEINEVITNSLNDGKYVGAVLVDLQKAFDTFDQKILLKKCELIGLRGKIHNIIKSYLTNRKATVKIRDEYSEFNEVEFGVPQGSVLGPLLFLIYTNDITDGIDKTLIYLFADDNILLSINWDYDEMIKNLQYDFNLLNTWFLENELFISSEKTIQMNISVPKMKNVQKQSVVKHHAKCKILQENREGCKCHNKCKKLEIKNAAKYLGIYIDSSWNFKTHISHVIVKLRQILPKIYQIKNILNSKNKKIIYEAWVASHLRYALEIYGFASDYLIDKLQKLQNKIVKLLFGSKSKKTSESYNENKILKIRQMRDYMVVIRNYYVNKFKNCNKDKKSKLRAQSQSFEIPRWRNKYGQRNKRWYIPTIFNKLPKTALNYQNLNELKVNLKGIVMETDKKLPDRI